MSLFKRFLKKSPRSRETPDPTPVEIPVQFRRAESMDERIARIVEHSISKEAERQGFETFDEANDFDVDDDLFPASAWETSTDAHLVDAVKAGVLERPDPERVVRTKDKIKAAQEKASKPRIGEDAPIKPKEGSTDAPKS